MSSLLKDYLDQQVLIVTVDGESKYGTLKGFDKYGNLILLEPKTISIIRSSEVVLCGIVDELPDEESRKLISDLPCCKNKKSIEEEVEIWKRRWSRSQGAGTEEI